MRIAGFQAVVTALQEVLLGDSQVVVAGGTESMSQSPYALRNVRWGTKVDARMAQSIRCD